MDIFYTDYNDDLVLRLRKDYSDIFSINTWRRGYLGLTFGWCGFMINTYNHLQDNARILSNQEFEDEIESIARDCRMWYKDLIDRETCKNKVINELIDEIKKLKHDDPKG